MALNEDQQTEAVFKSSRTEVDPVSGNEVPPGSLPEEVRDDIPAMLSEGEYVVPADVLRYYGMKFFEDLRAQAKMGLAEMEANGRIGGEPIGEETGDVGISDEDLMVIMAEAPQEEPQQVMANQGGLMGFQAGGLNYPAYIKQPDPTQFGASGPDMTGGLEYREYSNEAGMKITIPFFNGQPMAMIPEGYTPFAGETTAQPETQLRQDDGSEENAAQRARERFEASQRKEEAIDYSNPKSVEKAVDEYYAGSAAPALASIVPGGGLLVGGIRHFEKKSMIKNINDQLNNTSLDSDTAKELSRLKNELEDKDAYRDRVGKKGFGDTWLGDLLGFDDKGPGLQGEYESSLPDYSSKLSTLRGPQEGLEWMGSERDAYNAAVRTGNDAVVQHFEIVNKHREAREAYKRGESTGNTILSDATIERLNREMAEEAEAEEEE